MVFSCDEYNIIHQSAGKWEVETFSSTILEKQMYAHGMVLSKTAYGGKMKTPFNEKLNDNRKTNRIVQRQHQFAQTPRNMDLNL